MRLVKFRSPQSGNTFYVNPERVVSLTVQRKEGGIGIHLDDCTGGKDDYYLAEAESINEVADKLETRSTADALLETFSNAFCGGKSAPAFLEAIAMALGYGPDGHESAFEHISSSLDAIASAIETSKE